MCRPLGLLLCALLVVAVPACTLGQEYLLVPTVQASLYLRAGKSTYLRYRRYLRYLRYGTYGYAYIRLVPLGAGLEEYPAPGYAPAVA